MTAGLGETESKCLLLLLLQVLTQSFYTRLPARALATTRTRAGITPKLVLSLTTSDQVSSSHNCHTDTHLPACSATAPASVCSAQVYSRPSVHALPCINMHGHAHLTNSSCLASLLPRCTPWMRGSWTPAAPATPS